jgi:hypothetical protein
MSSAGNYEPNNHAQPSLDVVTLDENDTGEPLALERFEHIDSPELAKRWNLPETWVRERVRRRETDPIPHVRFGRYVRFLWGSPALRAWEARRIVEITNNRRARRVR